LDIVLRGLCMTCVTMYYTDAKGFKLVSVRGKGLVRTEEKDVA